MELTNQKNYLQIYRGYFWWWEEDATVITIPNGSTIAYTDLVIQAMEGLYLQGLPPFGALLMAFIGTNNSLSDDIEDINRILRSSITKQGESAHGYLGILDEAIAFLKILSKVPARYKTGNFRIQLFQALFESCHNILSIKRSKQIVEETRKVFGKESDYQFDHFENFSLINYHKDVRCISLLLKKFPTPEAIIEKIAALPNLNETVLPLKETLLVDKKDKNDCFIQELIDEPRTFQAGSLIKYFWSSLQIPFHQSLPGEQPLGGVSDLTNKGSFDKLLISEFANDDIVLLSRLANNEALYLQREVPPASHKHERIFLIDISLRNWGVPKLLSHAIAIAVSRHPKNNINCSTFVVGQEYTSVNHNNLPNVIESLQNLSDSLHAAEGLEQFLKDYKVEKTTELIFISSADAVKYSSMQKVINDNYSKFKYWIHIDEEGIIEISKNQNGSKKKIQSIQVPLTELWEKQTTSAIATQHVEESIENSKYPILFPTVDPKNVLNLNDEIIIISKERNVYKINKGDLKSHKKGLQLLYEGITSSASEFEVGMDEANRMLLLCYIPGKQEIVLYDLTNDHKKSILFSRWKSSNYRNFFFHENAFHYINHSTCWRIELYPEANIVAMERSQNLFIDLYQRRNEEIQEANQLYYHYQPVLKNVNHIYINYKNRLVINKHELIIDDKGIIRLSPVPINERQVKTDSLQNNNEFTFPDGSYANVSKAGLLILNQPKISAMSSCRVLLKNPGTNKIELIKYISSHCELSLKEAKEIVDNPMQVVKSNMHPNAASFLKSQLEQFGANATIQFQDSSTIYIPLVLDTYLGVASTTFFAGNEYYLPEYSSLQKINTKTFFSNYIDGFIANILKYGN